MKSPTRISIICCYSYSDPYLPNHKQWVQLHMHMIQHSRNSILQLLPALYGNFKVDMMMMCINLKAGRNSYICNLAISKGMIYIRMETDQFGEVKSTDSSESTN